MTIRVPYTPLPIDQTDVVYEHGPASMPRHDVRRGVTTDFTITDSAVFPGTERTVWVHRPSARSGEALPVMIFQDGWWYLDPEDDVRAAVVLDNLIDDPEARGLCGGSSGGNCGLTAAWHRPDAFRKVIALVSSFAQIPGGNPYPHLLTSTPRKPLRIFLQENHRDLGWNDAEDNWLAENLRTAAAFAESGYDFHFVLGEGEHTGNYGGVLLPDALRWLWRD